MDRDRASCHQAPWHDAAQDALARSLSIASCGLAVAVALAVAAHQAAAQSPRAWAGSGGTGPRTAPRRVHAPASDPAAAATQAAERSGHIPTGNLLATIRDGGILMVPLLGCSFLLAVFGIERAGEPADGAAWCPSSSWTRFVEQLQSGQLSRGEALDACEENGSPVAAGLRRRRAPLGQARRRDRAGGDRCLRARGQPPAPLPPGVQRHRHDRPAARPARHRVRADPLVQRRGRRRGRWAGPTCWPAASARR